MPLKGLMRSLDEVMAKTGLDEARLDMVVGWLSVEGVLTVSGDRKKRDCLAHRHW